MEKPKKIRMPMLEKAEKIAENLYRQYNIENRGGRDCGELLLEWIKEHFWGIVIRKHIPVFEKVWKILDKKGYTKNNKFTYGDIDVGVWVEYPKNSSKKVIVSTRYCSMADDNTHIFILDKSIFNWVDFRVVTVWPRENNKGGYRVKKSKKYPNGWFSWGDDRDIKTPSLNTYKKRDFHYGYYDCRDKGNCFRYKDWGRGGKAEKAHWGEGKIEHSLWTLRGHLEALKESNL